MKLNSILRGTLLLASASCLSFCSSAQTGIKVYYQSGTNQIFAVANDGKIYFDNDNLMIRTNASATPTSIPISLIRKLTFEEGTTTAVNEIANNRDQVKIYPNPAGDFLTISSEQTSSLSVQIYAFTGKRVLNATYKHNDNIDISSLSAGMYLIKINGVTLKFIKK